MQFINIIKDLGINADVKLGFHTLFNLLLVGRASFMINNMMRCRVCRSIVFVISFWVSHVRPSLEYGAVYGMLEIYVMLEG